MSVQQKNAMSDVGRSNLQMTSRTILVPEHLDDFHRATKLNLAHCPVGLMRLPNENQRNRSIKDFNCFMEAHSRLNSDHLTVYWVYCLPLFPVHQESSRFFNKDMRNGLKPKSSSCTQSWVISIAFWRLKTLGLHGCKREGGCAVLQLCCLRMAMLTRYHPSDIWSLDDLLYYLIRLYIYFTTWFVVGIDREGDVCSARMSLRKALNHSM